MWRQSVGWQADQRVGSLLGGLLISATSSIGAPMVLSLARATCKLTVLQGESTMQATVCGSAGQLASRCVGLLPGLLRRGSSVLDFHPSLWAAMQVLRLRGEPARRGDLQRAATQRQGAATGAGRLRRCHADERGGALWLAAARGNGGDRRRRRCRRRAYHLAHCGLLPALQPRCLQIVAAKGKQRMRTGGNTRQAQMAQQQMVRQAHAANFVLMFSRPGAGCAQSDKRCMACGWCHNCVLCMSIVDAGACTAAGPPGTVRCPLRIARLPSRLVARWRVVNLPPWCTDWWVQVPPTPPVDPENEEFVVFVRSKKVRALHRACVAWQDLCGAVFVLLCPAGAWVSELHRMRQHAQAAT